MKTKEFFKKELNNELIKAVKLANYAEVNKLLNMGADPNTLINEAIPLPYYSLIIKDVVSCEEFMAMGYKFIFDEWTRMIQSQSNYNIDDILYRAIELESTRLVKFILRNDPYYKSPLNLFNLLVDVCNFENRQIQEYIIDDLNLDINYTDSVNRNILHYCSQIGCGDEYFIINRGCNINLPDINGDTPLHIALKNGETYFSKFLIKNGADMKIPNNDQLTAMDIIINNNINFN